LIVEYAPNLDTLSLDLQSFPPSHNILASASNFTKLTRLTIHFGPQSSISGDDLILLAQKCPELAELYIGEEGHPPSGSGITNIIIDELAQKMPKISELILVFRQPDSLSWQSLVSFARHCKYLQMLKLSCNISWLGAVAGAQEYAFFALWSLELILNENNRELQNISDEQINIFVLPILTLAPKLKKFVVEGGNEVDQMLETAIMDVCMSHYL
jgi:hypothetical protein